ncbi:MAG: type II toxin-antitoxin system HicA family toxin [Promethearchaeota archaeon]
MSGKQLKKCLLKLGYEILRQKGSHLQLKLKADAGDHKITIPMHEGIAKGILNDILKQVSIWVGLSKEKLEKML